MPDDPQDNPSESNELESTDTNPVAPVHPLDIAPGYFNLLPDAVLAADLDPHVKELARQTQHALIVLGPAGGAVTVCPGNQATVPETRMCPLAAKCELLKAMRAPQGQLCPLERGYVLQRFADWSFELGKTPSTMTETERVTVSELTWIDLQELRCSTIVSKGEAARLHQKNVKEVHPETGEHLSWEWVVHTNIQLLDQLQMRRRMILKDWELTPEMKTRKAKIEGKGKGNDFSSQQSAKADKIRKLGPAIDN
jgi:hypothetical protein